LFVRVQSVVSRAALLRKAFVCRAFRVLKSFVLASSWPCPTSLLTLFAALIVFTFRRSCGFFAICFITSAATCSNDIESVSRAAPYINNAQDAKGAASSRMPRLSTHGGCRTEIKSASIESVGQTTADHVAVLFDRLIDAAEVQNLVTVAVAQAFNACADLFSQTHLQTSTADEAHAHVRR
jgi:hypothetical protein